MISIKSDKLLEIKLSSASGQLEVYDCLETGKEILLHKGHGFVPQSLPLIDIDLLSSGSIEWYINFYGNNVIIKIYDYNEFIKFLDQLSSCVTHSPYKSWEDIKSKLKKHFDNLNI